MEKPIFVQLGQKNRKESTNKEVLKRQGVTQEVKPNTHQETEIVVLPLATTQFFSSGLIMVG